MGNDQIYSNWVKRPTLQVYKCLGDDCETKENIDKFLEEKYFMLAILTKSYNTTNYN